MGLFRCLWLVVFEKKNGSYMYKTIDSKMNKRHPKPNEDVFLYALLNASLKKGGILLAMHFDYKCVFSSHIKY